MKNVVAYCRTGWASQSDPLSGVRLQSQELRRYAKGHGLVIRETYMDAGVSGMTLERPELQRLMADCRAGKIGTVVTQDPERLSRDTGQLIALLYVLLEAGVCVEFSTPQGRDGYAFPKILVSALAEVIQSKAQLAASSYVPQCQ